LRAADAFQRSTQWRKQRPRAPILESLIVEHRG